MAKAADKKIYNGFSGSYKLRFIVHGYRRGEEKTLCGRKLAHASTELFDREATGACKRCNMRLAIEDRMHPGWPKDG